MFYLLHKICFCYFAAFCSFTVQKLWFAFRIKVMRSSVSYTLNTSATPAWIQSNNKHKTRSVPRHERQTSARKFSSKQPSLALLAACLLVGESLRARTKQSRKRLHIWGKDELFQKGKSKLLSSERTKHSKITETNLM